MCHEVHSFPQTHLWYSHVFLKRKGSAQIIKISSGYYSAFTAMVGVKVFGYPGFRTARPLETRTRHCHTLQTRLTLHCLAQLCIARLSYALPGSAMHRLAQLCIAWLSYALF
jgi:hypothetical protein